MSNCCNPIIPPACERKCKQRYDACCVIDEQALPCIFDPIEVLASGIIGQDTVVVDDASGIALGMEVTGGGVGVGAVVTGISGTTVQLSVVNEQTFPGVSVGGLLTFNRINNAQCDINKAINDKLCNIGNPCPTWNVITSYSDPIMDVVWQTATGSEVAASNPSGCVVRLRGQITSDPIPMTIITAVNSQLFILPAPLWPSTQKVLSLTVVVNGVGGQWTALYLPALLLIGTDGKVSITFTNFNPDIPVATGCQPCPGPDFMAKVRKYWDTDTEMTVGFSLDGLTFNNR